MDKILTLSIAAYNAEKDIEKCLNSMLQTNVANQLEIIVVNDGSKDNTAQIVKGYVEKHPDIVKLIDKENGGHGSTINASIQVATGKYYKIVDSDDWVDCDGIEKLVKELLAVDVDLVLNPFHNIDAKTREAICLVTPFAEGHALNTVHYIDAAQNATVQPPVTLFMHAITFRTSVVQAMGPIISEKCFYVDTEYTLFPLPFLKTYICYDFPVYQYLLGTANQSMNIKNMINRRNQHLHVTKRITAFYTDHAAEFTPGIRNIILHRVKLAIFSQYVIYFSMEPRESKQEIVEFDAWLKTMPPEVYDVEIGRKFIKLVKLNRNTGFRFYGATVSFLKILNKVPKL